VESLSARSVATRAKLVASAEREFAERGTEGVSLNDINKLAGQRNKNATHYHFGSKSGLIQAILDKHEPGIALRRNELLDEFEARGELTLRNLVRAMLYPMAEKLGDPDGGPQYLRFSSRLVLSHTLSALKIGKPAFSLSSVDRLTTALRRVTPNIPEALALQRGILVGAMMMNGLADHSRMLETCPQMDKVAATRLFVANLEDCLTAVLAAPMSDETAAQVEA
jgi:AcrR family transcriptional regulator